MILRASASVLNWAALAVLLACATMFTANAAGPVPPLVLERTIPLAGVAGRIDHMAVDLARKRLIVAELGNNTVEVVDLASGRIVHRIEGLSEPQGVGYAPRADIIAVADGGDGTVRLFRGEDFSPAATVSLGEDADDVRLDAATGRFIISYGSGGLAILDPASPSVAACMGPFAVKGISSRVSWLAVGIGMAARHVALCSWCEDVREANEPRGARRGAQRIAPRPCIRLAPRGGRTMKQPFASAARLRGGGPILTTA